MIRIEMKDELALPVDIDRDNWGPLMTDVQLWSPVLTRIGSATGLDVDAGMVAGYPGSSAVFVIGEQAVIKIFPPIFAGDFAVERAAYDLLHNVVDAMPALLAAGVFNDRIEWPFLVLQFCPGKPIRTVHSQLSPAERLQIAEEVGRVVRTVHQTAVFPQAPFASWPAFLEQRLSECLVELREDTPLPEHLVAEIESFLVEIKPELEREVAVMVNADLTDDHVLLSHGEGQWRLSAIIDWADAEIAPPTYEWIAAWFGFCHRDAAMLRPWFPLPRRSRRLTICLGVSCSPIHVYIDSDR